MINEKYNFYSKITTVLIQQSCLKILAFKNSVFQQHCREAKSKGKTH